MMCKGVPRMIVIAIASVLGCSADQKDFTIHFKGVLAERLPGDTHVRLWSSSPAAERKHPGLRNIKFRVRNGCLALPVEIAGSEDWQMAFSADSTGYLFAIVLKAQCFQRESRSISIELKRPTAVLTQVLDGLRLSEVIDENVHYLDLPYWDSPKHTFGTPVPPDLVVYDREGSSPVFRGPMVSGCMGAKWFSPPSDAIDTAIREGGRCSVTHESGGLFPVINAEVRLFAHPQ